MKSSLKTSTKKNEPKKSSKFTSWPKNSQDRKRLYDKYRSGHENLSYQFLEMMTKGEEIFKGVNKQILKRAYLKADEIGSSKNEGLITRKEFPYFLKYLLYFTDLFKAFDKIDEDKNKKLTLDEFIKNRNVLEDKMTKARAEELFKSMDKDGGGSISFDEFCNWGLEQPSILNYNNNEFFVVDNTAQDDEDPEDIPEIKMKTQESEEVKEEDSSPKNKDLGEIDSKDNEIMSLKAKILDLERENNDLQKKLLEGSSNLNENQGDTISQEEYEKLKQKIQEQDTEINSANQREKALKEDLESKNNNFKKIESELEFKISEIMKLNEEIANAKTHHNFLEKECETFKKLHEATLSKEEQTQKELKNKEKEIVEILEKHQEERKQLQDSIQKLKEEQEDNTKSLKGLLAECENRCSQGEKLISDIESNSLKLKEDALKREAELQDEIQQKSKIYEEKIGSEVQMRNQIELKLDEMRGDYEKKISEIEGKYNNENKVRIELEDKLRVLEALNKEVSSDDLKKQMAEFEANKIQQEHNAQNLEKKIMELENDVTKLKLENQEEKKEKENLKKNHHDEITSMSSLQKKLEEKIRLLENEKMQKQIHEEKELKSKLEDYEGRKEEMRMAFDSRIKELEKENMNYKLKNSELEQNIIQIKNEDQIKFQVQFEKNEQIKKNYEEKIKNFEEIMQRNLKTSENNELAKNNYERKIQELSHEVNLYKIKMAESDKSVENIKKTHESKIKEIELREMSLHQHKDDEKFLKMKEESEKLRHKIFFLESEISDLKKKEVDSSKIMTENKSKEEIYGLLPQNKLDSNSSEIAVIIQKEQDISYLKRIISRLKTVACVTSLFGVGMLLLVLLKKDNCQKE